MKICVISDTHSHHRALQLPEADVLVHCGDFSTKGEFNGIANFCNWMGKLPYKHIVCISGNHELGMQRNATKRSSIINLFKENNIIYLEDSYIIIDGIKFYGSPWQPNFYSWEFNLPRGEAIARKWNLIPDDTDILITHGPPYGILDEVIEPLQIVNAGCEELLRRVNQLDNLKTHLFGHIHSGYGHKTINNKVFINASICDMDRNPTNKPIVFEL